MRLLSFGTTCEFHPPIPPCASKQVDEGKQFVELAHDTGAWGVKVRPNGFAKEVSREKTIENIGACLRELGEFGTGYGVEIWMEVHGRETQVPPVAAAIMKATDTQQCRAVLEFQSHRRGQRLASSRASSCCAHGSKSCHINELASGYPYRELFALMRRTKYDRWTLCECGESKEPERFLQYYRALWMELNRA